MLLHSCRKIVHLVLHTTLSSKIEGERHQREKVCPWCARLIMIRVLVVAVTTVNTNLLKSLLGAMVDWERWSGAVCKVIADTNVNTSWLGGRLEGMASDESSSLWLVSASLCYCLLLLFELPVLFYFQFSRPREQKFCFVAVGDCGGYQKGKTAHSMMGRILMLTQVPMWEYCGWILRVVPIATTWAWVYQSHREQNSQTCRFTFTHCNGCCNCISFVLSGEQSTQLMRSTTAAALTDTLHWKKNNVNVKVSDPTSTPSSGSQHAFHQLLQNLLCWSLTTCAWKQRRNEVNSNAADTPLQGVFGSKATSLAQSFWTSGFCGCLHRNPRSGNGSINE